MESSGHSPQNQPPNPNGLGATLSRREFLRRAGGGALLSAASACQPRPKAGQEARPEHPFAAFDREMEQFMAPRKVPGGALAVVKDRRLVYARGYGWADREAQEPVRAGSLFRIASVSKPITAVAALQLVEQGRLGLDQTALDLLPIEPFLPAGQTPDARLRRITVRHLLQHTGGWDRYQSLDPMFRAVEIAKALDVPRPAKPRDVIRYILGRRLDFEPGTRYAYSNFGYCVLGRIIERVSGLTYEQQVRAQVLAPIGIQDMRIGASLASGRAPGEVRYYTAKGESGPNVFPDPPKKVPAPYGTFHLEAMDAHGGWLASAVDLARFAAALDDPTHNPLLKPDTFATMYAPPPPPPWRTADGKLQDHYYGCGWLVRPVGKEGRANYWHGGSLPGTFGWLVRRWDGVSWVVLFNQRSEQSKLPDEAIDAALHRAADAVKEWPTGREL